MSIQEEYEQWMSRLTREMFNESGAALKAEKPAGGNHLGDDVEPVVLEQIEAYIERRESAEELGAYALAQLQEIAFWRWVALEGYNGMEPRMFPWQQRRLMAACYVKTGWSIEALSAESIVEIGCGPYGMIECLPGRCRVAYDPLNEQYGRLFSKVRSAEVEYVTCLETLARESQNAFDLGICFNVLDHTEDPKRIFDTLVSLIRPGGRVLLQVNTARDGYNQSEWHKKMHPSPLKKEEVLGWLEEDFEKVEHKVTDTPSKENEFFFIAWGTKPAKREGL